MDASCRCQATRKHGRQSLTWDRLNIRYWIGGSREGVEAWGVEEVEVGVGGMGWVRLQVRGVAAMSGPTERPMPSTHIARIF